MIGEHCVFLKEFPETTSALGSYLKKWGPTQYQIFQNFDLGLASIQSHASLL